MPDIMPLVQSSGSNDNEALYFRIVCDPGNERTARELQLLPQKLREQVWADLVGSESGDRVLPWDMKQRLKDLNTELQQGLLRTRSSKNTTMALALQTKLGRDETFRSHFLRTEDYNVKRAAARMTQFFEHKRILFGDEKLGKTIQLSDLSHDDLQCLRYGAIQLLPKTDLAGRLVFFHRCSEFKYKEPPNLVSTVVPDWCLQGLQVSETHHFRMTRYSTVPIGIP